MMNDMQKGCGHFIIIGVPKCGTSSLYKYLSQHPKVHLHNIKEQNYFKTILHDWTNKHKYRTKLRCLIFKLFSCKILRQIIINKYHKKIDRRDGFVSGDGSCSYFATPGVEKIIYSYYPKAKLILMLRNPVNRIYSNYWMNKKSECIDYNSFEEYIANGCWRLPENRYSENLERWLGYFKSEDILIIDSDDLFLNPQANFDNVCKFLNIPLFIVTDIIAVTPGSNKPGDYPFMCEEVRMRLQELFGCEQNNLYKLTGIKFNWFKV